MQAVGAPPAAPLPPLRAPPPARHKRVPGRTARGPPLRTARDTAADPAPRRPRAHCDSRCTEKHKLGFNIRKTAPDVRFTLKRSLLPGMTAPPIPASRLAFMPSPRGGGNRQTTKATTNCISTTSGSEGSPVDGAPQPVHPLVQHAVVVTAQGRRVHCLAGRRRGRLGACGTTANSLRDSTLESLAAQITNHLGKRANHTRFSKAMLSPHPRAPA